MAFTPVTVALVAPNTAEPDTFNDDADKWAADIIPWTAQVNAAGVYINSVGDAVDASALAAADSATAAADSAAAALVSEGLAAASADFKGNWSSLTGALNKPATVAHNGSFWALLNNLANVTASTPSLTNANWQFISGTQWQPTKTASFTVAINTMNSILATGSAVNATLTASATDGSFFVIANSAASTQTVMIMNAGYTIRNNRRSITSADNIVLAAGQTAYLRAISTTVLEVVING
jgi:hypothetical protein